jgi:Leucine-rich repeat (LRR) protein
MDSLNFDIINIIYSNLNNINDIYNLSLVNKYLYDIFKNNKQYITCHIELSSIKHDINKINNISDIFKNSNLKLLYNCNNYYYISSLEPIRSLINITHLDCSNNNISSLEPIRSLINITYLDFGNNNIPNIEPIKDLINIAILDCSDNQITSLEPIKDLINIESLYCYNNKITSLEPIDNLINIRNLYCHFNQILNF